MGASSWPFRSRPGGSVSSLKAQKPALLCWTWTCTAGWAWCAVQTHGRSASPELRVLYTMPEKLGLCQHSGKRHRSGHCLAACKQRSGPRGAVHSSPYSPAVRKTWLMFLVLESMSSSWTVSITTNPVLLGWLPWGICLAQNK